jgi:hypothetical protein
MNNRIQELVKQAGDYVNEVYTPPVRSKTPDKIWEDGHIGWNTLFNEKLAELIVQECVEQGKLIQSQTIVNGSEEYIAGREMGIEVFMNQIKQHFGVKESKREQIDKAMREAFKDGVNLSGKETP